MPPCFLAELACQKIIHVELGLRAMLKLIGHVSAKGDTCISAILHVVVVLLRQMLHGVAYERWRAMATLEFLDRDWHRHDVPRFGPSRWR